MTVNVWGPINVWEEDDPELPIPSVDADDTSLDVDIEISI